jgi:hypothetical protein
MDCEVSFANIALSPSAAYATRALDRECMVESEISQECSDFGMQLAELVSLVESIPPMGFNSNSMEIAPLKLSAPTGSGGSAGKVTNDLPELKAAVARAEGLVVLAQDSKNQIKPSDIKLAWEEVEELLARTEQVRTAETLGHNLLEECLVYEEKLVTACQALEELHRALNLQQTVQDNLGSF